MVCRVVHGSIGLISLVSIFDTIDVPIRLLRQLFLVLKQIGSYLIVCLITLLKIFSWQKPRSLCKRNEDKKWMKIPELFKRENGVAEFCQSACEQSKVLFEFFQVSASALEATARHARMAKAPAQSSKGNFALFLLFLRKILSRQNRRRFNNFFHVLLLLGTTSKRETEKCKNASNWILFSPDCS